MLWFLCGMLLFYGIGTAHAMTEAISFPISLECYASQEPAADGLWSILYHRVQLCPFNLVATLLFMAAIVHTLCAPYLMRWATTHTPHVLPGQQKFSIRTHLLHFLGETEIIFGLWVIPLCLTMMFFFGKDAVGHYLGHSVNYTEAFFMVVIMSIAGTRPILQLVETCLRHCARLGHESPAAWWFTLLGIAPLLGSFFTEPAAMTVTAMLLAKRFYALNPSPRFAYATLGLLFVNVSVGGTLTHIAAPPILMVVSRWQWTWSHVFFNLGLKALAGIAVSTVVYGCFFRKEFHLLQQKSSSQPVDSHCEVERPIPCGITTVHLIFLIGTIITLHTPVYFIGGFLLFLVFVRKTAVHQNPLALRQPILVGCFLAGLVIHGGLQSWWIAPVLEKLGETALFACSTLLTAFNDNAAITYLASLVPAFMHNAALQNAIVAGAVTGGGLTIIANAPNPAGTAILSKFFPSGISPLKLLLAALGPTLILAVCFCWL
ncbi:MAG: putative Na+/H+ antiporter [Puniceicoccales bacterium]|nr:putative Na+/H+ antiporter [Puniceicoccales bacterium]